MTVFVANVDGKAYLFEDGRWWLYMDTEAYKKKNPMNRQRAISILKNIRAVRSLNREELEAMTFAISMMEEKEMEEPSVQEIYDLFYK